MRVVLCGYYGMGNGGDEALLATALQMLPPGATPVVLSGNPGETARRYGVEAHPRKHLGTVVQTLRRGDAFVWGGGSLMQDATSALNPLYYGGLMALAQGLGLKTVAWGQGIGPLVRPWNRWATGYLLRRCTGVSLRDQASAAIARTWGLTPPVGPDPVWALAGEPSDTLAAWPTPRIGIALRPHPWLTGDRLDALTTALGYLQRDTQATLVLIPFQPQRDGAIARHLQAHLPGPCPILAPQHPQQLRGLFDGLTMVIAMRLHGLIMAAAAGCRCFALSYDPKVSQLMADTGMPGWAMDPAQPMAESSAIPSLTPWPLEPTGLTDAWLAHYHHGQGLSAQEIGERRDRAKIHQTVLAQALA